MVCGGGDEAESELCGCEGVAEGGGGGGGVCGFALRGGVGRWGGGRGVEGGSGGVKGGLGGTTVGDRG